MDSTLEYVWDKAVGGLHWLKEVVIGEFDDHRPMSAVVADMLVSFVPGVIIVTSARDLTAVVIRLVRHPEKREEVTEWMLVIGCAIPLILPVLAAAAGAAAAGVGAVVGGIGGSEAGAALRAVCLMLIERSGEMLETLIKFLRKFIKGDILAVLRDINFAKYADPLTKYLSKFIDGMLAVTRKVAAELAHLSWLESAQTAIERLEKLEKEFYAVQEAAVRKIPSALSELQARLTKALSEEAKALDHSVTPMVHAPKPKVVPVEPGRVPTMSESPLGVPAGTSPAEAHGSVSPSTNLHPQAIELHRPYIRKGVRAEVEARAPRTADGRFIDPNTGEPINGPYDLGHKPGHEFWREQQNAQAEGLTQQQFNDRMNNPDYYQIEDPSSNRSHQFEQD